MKFHFRFKNSKRLIGMSNEELEENLTLVFLALGETAITRLTHIATAFRYSLTLIFLLIFTN